MSYRTLADIEADIRFRFDVETFTVRHPQATIFRLINDAYRSFRDRLTSGGSNQFLSSVEATQSTTGRTSGYPGTLITAATLLVFSVIREVHWLLGTSWRKLEYVDLADALTNTDDSRTGMPMSWTTLGVTAETSSSVTVQGQNIVIIPPLDAARTFRVIGLAAWTDLSTSTDRLLIDAGILEYLVAYVGCILCDRDKEPEVFANRMQQREVAFAGLRSTLNRRTPAAQRVNARVGRVRW
jgi:hypothetical protein